MVAFLQLKLCYNNIIQLQQNPQYSEYCSQTYAISQDSIQLTSSFCTECFFQLCSYFIANNNNNMLIALICSYMCFVFCIYVHHCDPPMQLCSYRCFCSIFFGKYPSAKLNSLQCHLFHHINKYAHVGVDNFLQSISILFPFIHMSIMRMILHRVSCKLCIHAGKYKIVASKDPNWAFRVFQAVQAIQVLLSAVVLQLTRTN